MSYWHDQMAEIADWKYPEQIAFLRENHGFSQAHANALVMYSRGSKTTRRFNSLTDYLKPFDATKRATVNSIFKVIQEKYPAGEVVIAWNQPMFKYQGQYIFGVSVLTNHILMAPWSKNAIEEFRPRLTKLKVNKKTIQIPVDWKVEKKLILDLVKARISEIQ